MKHLQTSVSVKFRPSSVAGKPGSVYYQIIRDRKIKTCTSSYRIYPEEWCAERSSVRIEGFSPARVLYLQEVMLCIARDLEVFKTKIHRMEQNGDSTIDEIVLSYQNKERKIFSEFVNELISRLEGSKQNRLAEAYLVTSRSLKSFNKGKEVSLQNIDIALVENYESYLKKKGLSLNTISFYLRNIRSVYNKAIKEGVIDRTHTNPFSEVFTGVAKTRKRAVRQDVITQLLRLDIKEAAFFQPVTDVESLKKSVSFARDLFVLSFYLRGISFVDLAYLKKTNLTKDFITYVRCKTGQRIEIALTARIRTILKRYAPFCAHSEFLLPILDCSGDRLAYLSALKRQNRHLKKLSTMIGLNTELTTYVSRHSWASIALSKGYPVSIISQGLGHESEKTTQIYLDTFDYSVLHKANNDITCL